MVWCKYTFDLFRPASFLVRLSALWQIVVIESITGKELYYCHMDLKKKKKLVLLVS